MCFNCVIDTGISKCLYKGRENVRKTVNDHSTFILSFNSIFVRMKYLLHFLGFTSVLGVGNASNFLTGTSLGTSNLTAGAACACKELSSIYSSQVILPGSENYTAQANYYWDVRADLSPACVFMPNTADQVATAVKQFVQCDAQFAVRGGGHMNVSKIIDNLRRFTNGYIVPRIE